MQYMLMICTADDSGEPRPGTDGFDAYLKAYYDFTEETREKGQMVDGNPLQPISTATTVRVRGGKTEITDGPFAETKETLGGYYILECKDLDEAIECAAKIPGAAYGSIEVRPVMVMNRN